MTPSSFATLALSCILTASLTSCGTKPTASLTQPTRFLASTGTDVRHRVERLPFDHAWRDPKADLSKYTHIVVRPVTTAYLRSDLWEQSKSPSIKDKRAYTRRAEALARHWTKSLNKAFSSPVCSFYKTTDTSRPGTLILEVALTEVRFPRTAPGTPEVPLVAGEILAGPPFCAFEARTRDAATGRLISTAADKRLPEIKVVSSQPTSISSPNEAICDEWSEQLMQAGNKELFPKVHRSWFSLF